MTFHGQSINFYKKVDQMRKRRLKKSRLKIRSRRWDFFGKTRSLYIKQFRGNFWGNVRFKKNYAKKLAANGNQAKLLIRTFGNAFRSHYLLSVGERNSISSPLVKLINRKYRRFKNFYYPIDLTANKKFYRTFSKTLFYRHTRNIQKHRIKAFLNNCKEKQLRDIWRTGNIKSNMYSANLFTLRFISRLPHLLYFAGFTSCLELAKHLVVFGFVSVNRKIITNSTFLTPVMSVVQLHLPNFYKKLCTFLLFPYHRLYVSPYFEINWKLFTIRILRIPNYREVILPDGPFDHMFLYEQLSPSIN